MLYDVLCEQGDNLFRTSLIALVLDHQITPEERAIVEAAPLGTWVDFGGGAAATFSLCMVEHKPAAFRLCATGGA